MNAIIYARFSPRRREEDCVSIEKQVEVCEAYCKLHELRPWVVCYDRAQSGSSQERDGLQQALELVCEQRSVLVVHSLSRLCRSTQDALQIAQRIDTAGANLASVHDHIDTSSPMGRFFFTVTSALNQLEREQTAERTSEAMQHHQANGRRMTRADRLPYGQMIDPDDPDRTVESEEEAKNARCIRHWIIEGITLPRVRDKLNKFNLTCRGHRWTLRRVRMALTYANKMSR